MLQLLYKFWKRSQNNKLCIICTNMRKSSSISVKILHHIQHCTFCCFPYLFLHFCWQDLVQNMGRLNDGFDSEMISTSQRSILNIKTAVWDILYINGVMLKPRNWQNCVESNSVSKPLKNLLRRFSINIECHLAPYSMTCHMIFVISSYKIQPKQVTQSEYNTVDIFEMKFQ